jgi:hypothetical protein
MSERFIVKSITFDGDCIVDTTDDGYYTTDKTDLENLCGTLNEFNEENKRLKEFIRNLTNFKGEILLSNGRAYKREYVERLLE